MTICDPRLIELWVLDAKQQQSRRPIEVYCGLQLLAFDVEAELLLRDLKMTSRRGTVARLCQGLFTLLALKRAALASKSVSPTLLAP
jgi:hypothetical protein